MSKIMINIFGPPTAGKTTIADLLREHIEQLYTVDFDVVKHQISRYDWKRDSAIAQSIAVDTLISAAKTGLPIVVLLPKPKEQQAYEHIATAAHDQNYKLFNIEISAPEEVLIKRYEDRLLSIQDEALKRRMKNLDEFKVYVQTPYYRPADTITFDSSQKSPAEIFAAINELMEAV